MSTRVVVTGMGIISPLGVGLSHNWSRLIAGQSGLISTTTLPDYNEGWDKVPAKVIGKVPSGSLAEGNWDAEEHFDRGEARRLALFSQYAIASTQQALVDAKLVKNGSTAVAVEDDKRIGVAVGSGIGSFHDAYDNSVAFAASGYKKVQPLFIPKLLTNMAAGNISIKYSLKGPLHSVATACATGLQAVGDAYNFIKMDYADVMVCGGAEASIHPLALAGFARARSVTTDFNDDPTSASRPFDKSRSGFVLGEGCGILILEKLDHALARGLTEKDIYAEVSGYGISGDAHHITAPREDGEGAYNAMSQALARSNGITPQEIDYVNAHATSTVIGDRAENNAMARLFPNSLAVSSTKSSIGHLLGAAGAVEAIYTINAIKTSEIPPTLNLDSAGGHKDDDLDQFKFDYVANKSKTMEVRNAMCNSFGFGGVNSSVIFSKYPQQLS
ncbi:3-oxoacyl-synthase [Spathaspora passalidarum NRRL Y-27907]|uniref:3-oxoacyl-[acyl-carrier-protein] synthase n=1 Tax=Spathaspora passalidarum (strain NRRL Y-27907 / 11-Y1) TaxID=619300 RepID=G3AQ59_SPAPN|nr:3-oxoacyl-synthase [Spathaspora passalidarum NRRL Y-27907]EGW31406.1 3-oxoacyl-synthase [Spathaspora passalidarum NRRL Y-27907]